MSKIAYKIKNKLNSMIEHMSQNVDKFTKAPKSDFTRNRKLPFSTTVKIVLSMGGNSISSDLLEYFDYSVDTATASAFVQQRNKISSAALPFLFRKFTDSADTLKTYRGYRLLAADGSTIFAIFTTILETILYIVDFLIERRGFLWLLIRTLIYIFLFYFAYLSQITLAVNSRTNEYKADQFAYDVGFGDDLVSALYMLQKINISNKTTFLNKLRESHPHIAKRIGKLETMLESEETEQE